MRIICVNPQVPVHWDENLQKDFQICICIAFGCEETQSVEVGLISLNLVEISYTWNNRLKCYLFQLNIQF